MKLPLTRPLNAPIITLCIENTEYYFLIDTGCPLSFACRLRVLPEGTWLADQRVPLSPAPFSLEPLSERLGIPIEGFIGLRELMRHGRFSFDFDRGYLHLGHSAEIKGGSFQIELLEVMGAPIGIKAQLDEHEERTFFIDTGSRFVTLPTQLLSLDPSRPIYPLGLVSPQGFLNVNVSPNHLLKCGSMSVQEVCVAEGVPEHTPPLLGMEWLSAFHAHFDLIRCELSLYPREQREEASWARLHANLSAPRFEPCLDPALFSSINRPFSLFPRSGSTLPSGLLPFTPYRIKNFEIPTGIEGVNELYHILYGESADPITLISEHTSEEYVLERSALFQENR